MSNGSRQTKSKSTFHFAAGLGSGLLSAVLLQPIDLLKTRVQQSGHHSLDAALREIWAQPRVLPALWRGATPSALRTGFGSAIYFTSLNAIRNSISQFPFLAAADQLGTDRHRSSRIGADGSTTSSAGPSAPATADSASSSSSLVKLSNTGNLLAGAVARTFAGMILMPLTVIKVRYESNLYAYRSLASASSDIYKSEGFRGFFSGFGATAIRDAPYAGLYVLFYEQSKKQLGRLYGESRASAEEGDADRRAKAKAGRGDEVPPSPSPSRHRMGVPAAATINFSSGIIAGAGCSAISNPFDAVKTRIQLQPGHYRNMLHAGRRMVAEEGFRSLLDGLMLRMSRKALSSALAWTLYEELVRRAERTLGSAGRRKESVL